MIYLLPRRNRSISNTKMFSATRGWQLRFVLLVLLCATERSSSACTSLLQNNGNVKFTASSSSLGPGRPLLHGNDVWCAGVTDTHQFLKVDLGSIFTFDQVFVQGKAGSHRSVSQYYVKTSTDNSNFVAVEEHGRPKDFSGPLFSGDAVVGTNLTSPVQARWVVLNPQEPLSGNYLCMRIDIRSCQNAPTTTGIPSSTTQPTAKPLPPVNGLWASWGAWSACTKTCGKGTRVRSRRCNTPIPAGSEDACRGGQTNTGTCLIRHCPIAGNWASWGAWSACSQTCGHGIKVRFRSCNNPTPAYGGAACKGDAHNTAACLVRHCPVAGNWSTWTAWPPCSETCGSGTRVRTRLCNNPAPAYGGAACEGDASNKEACLVRHCPVAGNWSTWTAWSTCSETCGSGTRARTRLCNNPASAYGGADCKGVASNTEVCLVRHCPVAGNWSAWVTWSPCSKTCGSGTRIRTRLCNSPAPAHGGADCKGEASTKEACLVRHCPVAGNWSNWGAWSPCSETCGNGTRVRTRLCNNPSPAHGGTNCKGDTNNTEACFVRHCPIYGSWSAWGAWSACSETCGNGTRVRTRLCNNPYPAYGGAYCKGDRSNTEACLIRHCSVAGNWSNWGAWSPCSETCGNGTRVRTRLCINPAPAHGGADCKGDANNTEACLVRHCPVAGNWSTWGAWSACSETCGNGTRVRTRLCNNPSPANGGPDCKGDANNTETCFVRNCLKTNRTLIDVVFTLIASSSISKETYTLMENTVKQFIAEYVANYYVIAYIDGVMRVVNLTHSFPTTASNLNAVLGRSRRTLDAPAPLRSGPLLINALQEALIAFQNGSFGQSNNRKALAVMTDINSTADKNSLETAVRPLEESGILVISVPIGAVNRSKLLVISPNPLDVISVDKYLQPFLLADRIRERIIRKIPEIDVAFAISASSISSKDIYDVMVQASSTINERYKDYRVRFNVIIYGNRKTSRLRNFFNTLDSHGDLIASSNSLPIVPSLTLREKLLEAERLFRSTGRPMAKKVFAPITDTGNGNEIITASDILRSHGVVLLSLNRIGDQLNSVTISHVDYLGTPTTTTDRRVVIAESIIYQALRVNPPELDVTFALSATSVNSKDTFTLMRSTIISFINLYGIERIHYSAIVFGSGIPTTRFDFATNIPDEDDLIRKVIRLPKRGGSPELAMALEEAKRIFELREVRPNARRILVVIIDNATESSREELSKVVHALVNNSVFIVGVGIGSSVNPIDLHIITREVRHTLTVGTNKAPDELGEEIMRTIELWVRTAGFSLWGRWSECSKTCSSFGEAGTQRRNRTCINAKLGCEGPLNETRECNNQTCPDVIDPSDSPVAFTSEAGNGILIALWVLAGILTSLLLMFCCYYCCWHVCCGRGKKRKGITHSALIEDEEGERWVLVPADMALGQNRAPETEIQEVFVEIGEEEGKPAGAIQFGVVADQSQENRVTAETVHSEPPVYSEEVAVVNSNASTLKMEPPEPRYANVEKRKPKKDQKGLFKIRRKLGRRFSKERFESNFEWLSDPFEHSQDSDSTTSARGLDDFSMVDYEMFEERRGSDQSANTVPDGYMRMNETSREPVNTSNAVVDRNESLVAQKESSLSEMEESVGESQDQNVKVVEEWFNPNGRGVEFRQTSVKIDPVYSEVGAQIATSEPIHTLPESQTRNEESIYSEVGSKIPN